jgi:hypothetical protein
MLYYYKEVVVFLILLFVFACSSDVSVIKHHSKETAETESGFEPGVGPSGEPGTPPPPEIEGNGGYIHFYLRQIACPGCVGEQQELLVEFGAKFFQPTNEFHTSWIPELGECTNQLLITSPSTVEVDVGDSITVIGPAHSFTAQKQGSEYYAQIYETQYDRNATYNVSIPSEDAEIQFLSMEGYDYIEPQEMLFIDPSYAFAAPIYRTGMTFSWAPYDTSRTYMILLAAYSPDGSQLLGYAACTGPDQGFLTFPASALQSFPLGALVLIHLSRHQIDFFPYEPMGSHIETHMEWEVVGTGYMQ